MSWDILRTYPGHVLGLKMSPKFCQGTGQVISNWAHFFQSFASSLTMELYYTNNGGATYWNHRIEQRKGKKESKHLQALELMSKIFTKNNSAITRVTATSAPAAPNVLHSPTYKDTVKMTPQIKLHQQYYNHAHRATTHITQPNKPPTITMPKAQYHHQRWWRQSHGYEFYPKLSLAQPSTSYACDTTTSASWQHIMNWALCKPCNPSWNRLNYHQVWKIDQWLIKERNMDKSNGHGIGQHCTRPQSNQHTRNKHCLLPGL